jgi:hypothetical protein
VFEYTRDSIAARRQAGVLPDMVQIGNEVDHGILWPAVKLPGEWDDFAALVKAGINGDAGRGNGPRPRIMIHIAKGGDRNGTRRFLDRLESYRVEYDVIGHSYYPWVARHALRRGTPPKRHTQQRRRRGPGGEPPHQTLQHRFPALTVPNGSARSNRVKSGPGLRKVQTGRKKRTATDRFRSVAAKLKIWCGEGDLNPHALSSASTSS